MGKKELEKYVTSPTQKRLQRLILSVADKECVDFSTGGCTPFYSPKQWKEREEEWGLKSKLIVVHLAYFFNYDYESYSLMEKMRLALEAKGYWVEQCTSWYSCIYKK